MLSLLVMTALSSAHAAPPNRVVEVMATGGAGIEALATADDGGLVAAATGDGVWAVDTEGWESSTWDGCAAAGVAIQRHEDGTYTVWAACDDGVVEELAWAGGRLEAQGTGTTLDGVETLLGVQWDPTGQRLYVLAGMGSAAPRIHAIEPAEGVVDPTGYPVNLVRTGYVDWVITASRLLVAHGGDDMSTLTLGATVPTTNIQPFPYSVNDLAPSIRDTAYAADNNGLVLEFQPGSGTWIILANEVGDADAVGASDWQDDEWLAVSRSDRVDVYALANGALVGAEPVETFDAGGSLSDIVVGPRGYGFGAMGPDVVIMSANPWVSGVVAAPTSAVDGEAVTVEFEVDVPVDWELRLSSATGAVLAEGTLDAGGPVAASVTVDERWVEGANRLVVVATDGEGRVGTRGVTVTVDNPPSAVALTDAHVGFGNGRLVLTIPAVADEDIARFDVYVTTTSFVPEDWPTGGPPFDGTDALTTPIVADATAGVETEVVIEPLTNDVLYYIAVRAVDAGGLEGPMSAVVSGSPRPTYSASQLNGDEGGPACATLGFAGIGLPVLLAAVLTRRRRLVAAGALFAVASLAPGVASAEPRQDETDAWFNVEAVYGSANIVDPGLRSTYGASGHDILRGEFGVQVYRFFELDAGVGYYRDKATTTDGSGEPSGEESRFTQVPLSLDATLRIHALDEQPVVPFARAGLDYVLWNEAWQVGESTDRTRGAKAGFHYGVGGQLLLDTFAPGRASRLEANYGINDTWITVEWRRQFVEPGKFLGIFDNSGNTSLSASFLTVGLKLDY